MKILAAAVLALSLTACQEDKPSDAGTTQAPPPAPINQAPSIGGLPAEAAIVAGDSFQVTPTATDPENDPMTFEVTNKPAWATFSESTGVLSGIPGENNVGTYENVQISVKDRTSTTRGNPFRVRVNARTVTPPPPPANRAPVISGSPATAGREGLAYTFTPSASDPDGNALGFSISNKPAWAAFSVSSGQLSGTPPAGAAGNFQNIVISASDGNLSASLPAFSISVSANRAPAISGSPATVVTAGQSYSFTPAASDADGNALTFSIANRPSWATFNSGTGRLSGTPTAAQAGTYANIQIRVTDSLATTSLPAFQIVVDSGNRAPVISGSPATSIVEGQAYSFTPTASDPDGNALTFSIANRPSWATFSTTTGRLSGTPGAGTVGNYANIQISVSDNVQQASLSPFAISVQQAANGQATLSWAAPTTRSDGSPLTNLAGYKLRYGNAAGTYPNTITVSNPGITTYMVENLAAGTYYFAIASYDSAGVESINSSPVSKTIP